jgi:hypothetical protein
MANDGAIKSFFTGIASNAAWEWIKALGGGLGSAMTSALIQYMHHRPIDWWGLLILGLVTTLVLGLIFARGRLRNPASNSSRASTIEVWPDPYAGVLSPLQLDTLRLAKRMREFHAEIKSDWTHSQMMHGYASRFNKDLADIMHRLGEAKIGVGFLHPYTQAITDSALIMGAARLLEKLALQLNDVAIS